MANAISAEVIGYMLMGVLVTKIKEYRESAGMKQAELAELVNARRKAFPILFTTETT